jgi:hypothetical protein
MTSRIESPQPYEDREHAGVVLARRLEHFTGGSDVVVLALPRGGVPVAHEVARALGVPLDVFLVRKLGVPGHRELAMGAIASGGVRILNDHVITAYRIPGAAIDAVAREEQVELERRERTYRDGRSPVEIRGRTVLLIDDGLATGAHRRGGAGRFTRDVSRVRGCRRRDCLRPRARIFCRGRTVVSRLLGDVRRGSARVASAAPAARGQNAMSVDPEVCDVT